MFAGSGEADEGEASEEEAGRGEGGRGEAGRGEADGGEAGRGEAGEEDPQSFCGSKKPTGKNPSAYYIGCLGKARQREVAPKINSFSLFRFGELCRHGGVICREAANAA